METKFSHLLFSIDAANMQFYRDLLGFLGWNALYESPEMSGYGDSAGGSMWFGERTKDVANDYDGPGMNHVGIAANSIADVDSTATYLADRGVAALFETPRHRPDFSADEKSTYYQVMFESPDRILFEVVYTGPK